MTRTKKMLLTALAAALFTGVAVGAEIADTNDRASYPEPIPAVTETETEAMAGRGDCPEFDATKAEAQSDELKLTCDRHVVNVE